MFFTRQEIIETLTMVQQQRLDVRTITLGLSLRSCADKNIEVAAERVYDHIVKSAHLLVPVAQQLEREYGVPIINQRISVTPIAQLMATCDSDDATPFALALDAAAKEVDVDFIGGFSALVHKNIGSGSRRLIASLPEALSSTTRVCSAINVGSTRSGINMDAVLLMAQKIKEVAESTKDEDSIGCAKLVTFMNMVDDNPFMAGATHNAGEGDAVINVGISGPGVVRAVLSELPPESDLSMVAEAVKSTAFKITRVGELIAREAAKRMKAHMGIVDLSLAPTPAEGDSVAAIIEAMGIGVCGGPGTTAALALLNDAVKKGGAFATANAGGLSGAFIPVSEDANMIKAAEMGALSIEKLEAMTAVCSVGLDMIAIPGDTTVETIAGIIADECAIGMVNSKTTAVRVIPAVGKDVGDTVSFGGLLGYAPIMPVNKYAGQVFARRGGRIPAPLQALKN